MMIVKQSINQVIDLYNKNEELLKSKSYEASLRNLDHLLSLSNNSPIPELIRSNINQYVFKKKSGILREQRDYENSIFWLIRWKPTEKPDLFTKFTLLADMSRKTDQFREAIDYYQQATKHSPSKAESGVIHNRIGVLYFTIGDYHYAMDNFKFSYLLGLIVRDTEAQKNAFVNVAKCFRALEMFEVSNMFFARVFEDYLKSEKEKREFLKKYMFLEPARLKVRKIIIPQDKIPQKLKIISFFVKNIVPLFPPKLLRQGQAIFMAPRSSKTVRIETRTMEYVDIEKNEVKCNVFVYRPRYWDMEYNEGVKRRCIIFYHGGGYVLGHPNQLDYFFKKLVEKGDFMLLAMEYRKAPENRLPRGIWDSFEFLHWVKREYKDEIDFSQVTISGESAGGQISLYCGGYLRDNDYKLMKKSDVHLIPIYPGIDGSFPFAQDVIGAPLVDKKNIKSFAMNARPSVGGVKFMPNLMRNVNNFPSMFLITCEYCVLKDEGYMYYRKCKKENKEVYMEYKMFKNECHGFITKHLGVSDNSREVLVDDMIRSINQRFEEDF